MSIDTRALGEISAQAMEQIEREWGQEPDARLGAVVIAFQVFYNDDDGDKHVVVATGSTSDDRVLQTGILDWALDGVKDTKLEAGDGDDYGSSD